MPNKPKRWRAASRRMLPEDQLTIGSVQKMCENRPHDNWPYSDSKIQKENDEKRKPKRTP